MMKDIEKQILEMLHFNISRPTAFSTLRLNAMVLNYGTYSHHFTKLIVDLIILNNKTCHFSPSIATVMAICIAQKCVSSASFDILKYYNEMIIFPKYRETVTDKYRESSNSPQSPKNPNQNINSNAQTQHLPNHTYSINQIQENQTWLEVMTKLTGYPLDILQPGILEIAKFMKKVFGSNKTSGRFKCLYDKFDFLKELRLKFLNVANEIITKNSCDFSSRSISSLNFDASIYNASYYSIYGCLPIQHLPGNACNGVGGLQMQNQASAVQYHNQAHHMKLGQIQGQQHYRVHSNTCVHAGGDLEGAQGGDYLMG